MNLKNSLEFMPHFMCFYFLEEFEIPTRQVCKVYLQTKNYLSNLSFEEITICMITGIISLNA